MKSGLKRATLGLLLLPLLGAATSCSSPDDPSSADPGTGSQSSSPSGPSSSSSPPASGSTGSASASSTAAPDGEESTSADPGAVVQSPQPAPEPTFDAPQEKFLAGKVPEGTDPNAVLQVGQERCDQLTSAKAVDADSVISELIMNPAPDTADAIAALCPELLPELEASGRGFPDGVFSVGPAAPHGDEPSVEPGTYRSYGAPAGCTLSVYAGGGELMGSHDGSAPVVIDAAAARVESDQCYSWFRA